MPALSRAEMIRLIQADLEAIHPRGRTVGELLGYVIHRKGTTSVDGREAVAALLADGLVTVATRRHPTCHWIEITEYFAATQAVSFTTKKMGAIL